MQSGLLFLEWLDKKDADWLLANGVERQLKPRECLILEGAVLDNLYLILHGRLSISIGKKERQYIKTIGPGEILGEIAFLENGRAGASAESLENSLILCISKSKLNQKIAIDLAFGGRFYRALAQTLSMRLKENNRQMGQVKRLRGDTNLTRSRLHQRFRNAITDLKSRLQQFDRLVDKGQEKEAEESFHKEFSEFVQILNNELESNRSDPLMLRDEIGRWMHRELLPYIQDSKNGRRWYEKPRGYPGDFQTLVAIDRNEPEGNSALGLSLDRFLLNLAPCRAVRQRKSMIKKLIREQIEAKRGDIVRICSLASGPAAEIFEIYETLENTGILRSTLVDIDIESLNYVRQEARNNGVFEHMRLNNSNMVYLATGDRRINMMLQDMTYSLCLSDYFSDNYVIQLLNYIYSTLRPGGKAVLGNFHPANPCKAFMDYIVDWRLLHRSEDDINRLFKYSAFGKTCDKINFDDQGILFLAECVKA